MGGIVRGLLEPMAIVLLRVDTLRSNCLAVPIGSKYPTSEHGLQCK